MLQDVMQLNILMMEQIIKLLLIGKILSKVEQVLGGQIFQALPKDLQNHSLIELLSQVQFSLEKSEFL